MRGTLVADLLAGTVQLSSDGATHELYRAAPGERDRAERSVIEDLLDIAAGRPTRLCTPDEAVDVLELVEAARRSAATGRTEAVGNREVLGR